MTRDVHVIVPCTDPRRCPAPAHAAGAPVLDAFSRLLRDERDVAHALRLHRHEYDVPRNSPTAAADLLELLAGGRHLVQFRLAVPDVAAERAAAPLVLRTPPPPGVGLLGVRSLSRLACVPRRRARYAFDHGLLTLVESTALRGRVCAYALVDERMDAWAQRHARFVPLNRVDAPKTNGGFPWFMARDVRAAGLLHSDQVFTDGRWLRWAASHMPEGERKAILAAQVTSPATS